MYNVDCIAYINDLYLEIQMLSDIKQSSRCNIDDIDKQIEKKKNIIVNCKENLKKISNNQIYYRLYLKILNGITPSKAVKEVAEENYLKGVKPCSINGIWNYYNKLKKILNNL